MSDDESPKTAIERALVRELADCRGWARGYTRIYNEGPDGGRLFGRLTPTYLRVLSVKDIVDLDDETFKKFTDRLRMLQEVMQSSPLEPTGSPDAD